MNVIILEDEQPNIDLLESYMEEYSPDINIIGTFKSKNDIRNWVQNSSRKIDLAFCDIELLDGSVFTFLADGMIDCPIIFTTAYNDFYQEAFDANGIAYLLKPISYRKFASAMDKFMKMFPADDGKVNWQQLSLLLHRQQKNYKERIVIKTRDELHILNLASTAAILSNAGKLTAVDNKGQEHEFRYKLSDLAEELDPNLFFQINRGEIVNINFIEKIQPYFGDRLSIKIKNYKNTLITSAAITPEFRKWLG